MRYILIQTSDDPLTHPERGVWINADHIVSVEYNEVYTTIRLANGDSIETRNQDDVDILSMLNLNTTPSCGSLIADHPGVPARTEMVRDNAAGTARALTRRGWVEVEVK